MQRAKVSRSIVGPLNRNGSLSLADARKHAARSRLTSASGAPGLSYTSRPLLLAQPTSSPMIPTTRIPVVGHLMALLLPSRDRRILLHSDRSRPPDVPCEAVVGPGGVSPALGPRSGS